MLRAFSVRSILYLAFKTNNLMKKILIPTDFSDASRNALRYALRLMEKLPIESIVLAHVFLPDTRGEADFIPPIGEVMKSREAMLEHFLEEIGEEEGPFPTKITPKLLVGFPADELVKASEDYDIVVMGATGAGGVLERIFGSVSSSVAQRAHCPVLVVPEGLAYQPLKHIVYASHYDSSSPEVVEKLINFNRNFNAHLHFVQVREAKDLPFEASYRQIFEELFDSGEPPFSFDMAEVSSSSVAEGLNDYAEQQGAQMIVMATKHRGFWGQILHRSQTKRMALTTELPLMVLHI